MSLLGLLAPAAAPAAAADAAATLVRRWTFEMPGYGSRTSHIADHCLLRHEGRWHLFHTHVATAEEPDQYIGHAVSDDLRDWEELPRVLTAAPDSPEWRRNGVWAPHVVPDPSTGGFVMSYTGNAPSHAQRLGFLRSNDLLAWEEIPAAPLEPDTSWYSWTPHAYASCRDPHLLWRDGIWHLVFAARDAEERAAVGHATSADLLSWQQGPPLMVTGNPGGSPDLESPGILPFDGTHLLFYTWLGFRVARGDSLLGPYTPPPIPLDGYGSAGELIPSGNGLLTSRRRPDPCRPGNTVLVIDSVNVSQWPYRMIGSERLPGWIEETGELSVAQPTFGDGPRRRGEEPSLPGGLYLFSTRESHPEPGGVAQCWNVRGDAPRGSMRSLPFVLAGDSVAIRIAGAASPDSARLVLRDACTQEPVASFTGGSSSLVAQGARPAATLGDRVEWRIEDVLDRPGGWLELDDLELLRTDGETAPAPRPALSWVHPDGLEPLNAEESISLQWDFSPPAAIDSIVLYATTDGGRTLERQGAVDPELPSWIVPDAPGTSLALRLVAYLTDGGRECATTGTLAIAGVVSAPLASPQSASLRVRYAGGRAWLEGSASDREESVLELFDVRGAKLAVLWRGRGRFVVPLPEDGSLPPGIAFARLRGGGTVARVSVWAPSAAAPATVLGR